MFVSKRWMGHGLGMALAASAATVGGAAVAGKTLVGDALVDAYVQCWGHFNQREWDAFEGCYTKDAVSQSAGLPDAKGGKAIVELHAKPFAEAFPDGRGQQQLTLSAGPHVVSITLFQGTHKGPLKGPAGAIPPTGKKIGFLLAHAVQAKGDKAAGREWMMADNGTMFAQLGLAPHKARPAIVDSVATPVTAIATGTATEKKNLAAAKKLYALFNKHDKAMSELAADDVIDANAALPADVKGKEAVVGFVTGFWQMSSDVKVTASKIFAAGDYVASIGTFSGTNDGDLPAMGIKKTGKKFNIPVIEITKWQDGKLKEIWPFYDGADFAMQLGLMPPHK